MDIGKRIVELRQTLNISQYRLHKDSGVPQSTLSNIETGEKQPTIPTLELICKGLKVTLAEFFNIKDTDDGLLIINESAADYNVSEIKKAVKQVETELLAAVEKHGIPQEKVDRYTDLLKEQTKIFLDQTKK